MSLLNQITSSPIFPFLQNVLETHTASLFQSRRSQSNHHHQIFSITTSMISYSLIELIAYAYWFIYFICTRPFDQRQGLFLLFNLFFFLIVPIFCLLYSWQYCPYISYALFLGVLPLNFVNYIHESVALIFRMVYSLFMTI